MLNKLFLSLSHEFTQLHRTYTESGLRKGLLSSTLCVYSEGLSPDVTLFLFPKKQYVSVSFSKVLSLFKFLVTTTNAQAVILDKIKKLLTVRREIGNSERFYSLSESRRDLEASQGVRKTNHRRGWYILNR